MADYKQSKKADQDDVVVTFNGRETTLHKWIKNEVAATDQDRMRDWRDREGLSEEEENELPLTESEEEVPHTIEDESERNPSFDSPPIYTPSPTNHYTPSNKGMQKSSSQNSDIRLFIQKFWIPFLSAIIVGLGFGFTVLMMFTHHQSLSPLQDGAGAAITTSAPVSTEQTTSQKTVTASGQNYALNLYVLQLSVYSTEQNAQTDQATFDTNGIHSAVIQNQGKYALFAGVGLQSADLSVLKTLLGSKTDTYGKNVVIMTSKLKGSKSDLQNLKTANLIIQNLIPLSLDALQSKPVDQSVLKEVNKALQEMKDPSSASQQKDLGTLKGTLLVAYSALTQSTPDGKAAQKALLDGISSYQVILQALTAK